MQICPKCKRKYDRLLALSRTDNKTMICDECGTKEALDSLPHGLIPQKRQYEIFLFGCKSICPECSGLLTTIGNMKYYCIDCHSIFNVVDIGRSDNKVICEIEQE